jgi:hypothetical protein
MAETENDRKLDTMLDSLLAAYSAAEPRPGLELRLRAGLNAHAARRRSAWTLGIAVAAAVVLVASITRLPSSKPAAPGNPFATTITPLHSGPVLAGATIYPPQAPGMFVSHGQALARKKSASQLLLQLANSLPEAGDIVLKNERRYLVPVMPEEPQPANSSETSAPNISIQDLGVQSIEIKELPSATNADAKGNLR